MTCCTAQSQAAAGLILAETQRPLNKPIEHTAFTRVLVGFAPSQMQALVILRKVRDRLVTDAPAARLAVRNDLCRGLRCGLADLLLRRLVTEKKWETVVQRTRISSKKKPKKKPQHPHKGIILSHLLRARPKVAFHDYHSNIQFAGPRPPFGGWERKSLPVTSSAHGTLAADGSTNHKRIILLQHWARALFR